MGDGKPLDERVASLEVTVSSVAESVRSLAHAVTEGFAQGRRDRDAGIEAGARGLRDVQAELARDRESRRPQYQTQAAWAAVVLTVVFGAWSLTSKGYDRDNERLEKNIAELQATRLDATYHRGSLDGKLEELSRVVEQIAVNAQRITALEAKK